MHNGNFDAVLIPDGGHCLILENPDEFNRQLRAIAKQFPHE